MKYQATIRYHDEFGVCRDKEVEFEKNTLEEATFEAVHYANENKMVLMEIKRCRILKKKIEKD